MAQDNLSLDHNLGEGTCVRQEDEEVGQRDHRRHWYMPRTPIAMEGHSEVVHMNKLLRGDLSVLGEDKEGQPHKQQNRESGEPRGSAIWHHAQAMPIAHEDREEADHPLQPKNTRSDRSRSPCHDQHKQEGVEPKDNAICHCVPRTPEAVGAPQVGIYLFTPPWRFPRSPQRTPVTLSTLPCQTQATSATYVPTASASSELGPTPLLCQVPATPVQLAPTTPPQLGSTTPPQLVPTTPIQLIMADCPMSK